MSRLTARQRVEGLKHACLIAVIALVPLTVAMFMDVIPAVCETGHWEHRHTDAYDVPTLHIVNDGRGNLTTTVDCCDHVEARDWEQYVCDEPIPGVKLYQWLFQNRSAR